MKGIKGCPVSASSGVREGAHGKGGEECGHLFAKEKGELLPSIL